MCKHKSHPGDLRLQLLGFHAAKATVRRPRPTENRYAMAVFTFTGLRVTGTKSTCFTSTEVQTLTHQLGVTGARLCISAESRNFGSVFCASNHLEDGAFRCGDNTDDNALFVRCRRQLRLVLSSLALLVQKYKY